MTDRTASLSHLEWPFFEPHHRKLADELESWASSLRLPELEDAQPGREVVDRACRKIVGLLGKAGFLRICVPQSAAGGGAGIDCRAICIAREILARYHALLDFAFAMQGLGSGAVSLAGTLEQQAVYLADVASGERIAAFALSEPHAGSDVGAMECTAERCGDEYVIDGEKTWISNGGIAGFYVVFARAPGTKRSAGVSAFLVDEGTPGLEIAERIDVMSPHPLARLRFRGCRIPAGNLLGVEGGGFKLAMQTLDIFRTSVAAAALGFARSALEEALGRANDRAMFGTTLGALQLTQAKLADMACATDAAALLVYRAAWMKDGGRRITREAAMAKLVATESAQRVVDAAVQIFGGEGVRVGSRVERLYRDVRALRIYEGATEVQQMIIGSDLLKELQQRRAGAQDTSAKDAK